MILFLIVSIFFCIALASSWTLIAGLSFILEDGLEGSWTLMLLGSSICNQIRVVSAGLWLNFMIFEYFAGSFNKLFPFASSGCKLIAEIKREIPTGRL